MNARHALVTGGAGFIGSHLVERLIARGYAVHVLDDLSRGKKEWIHPDAVLHEADIRDAEAVGEVVGSISPSVVAHLAALHYIPAVDDTPDLAWSINVGATEGLLAALAANPPTAVIFASTAAVYPQLDGPIPESAPLGPIDLYGRTKVRGEELAAGFAATTGANVVCARLFNVIGARETNPHVIPDIIEQLRDGGEVLRLGNLESQRDYNDVVDVSDALARLIDAPPVGLSCFNVGSGRGVSVHDVVKACEAILARPLRIEIAPERVRAVDRPQLIADSSALRMLTGWRPTRTLEETLSELLNA